jgi:putative aldouronate transport system permease protein
MTTMNETKNTPRKLRDGMIKSRKTRIGDLVIAFICLLLMLLCLLPMLHVLAASLSSPEALVRNEVFIWPKGWNIDRRVVPLFPGFQHVHVKSQ